VTDLVRTWFAPGRVNLIGEHTDYNAGFALPFAIAHGCTACAAVVPEPVVTVVSRQRPDVASVPLTDLEPAPGWAGYVLGVVWALQRRGVRLPGLRIIVDSTVPVGAGLSSSAALTCSVGTVLQDLLDLRLSSADLLAITRSAENDFVGARTGGLDQLASLTATAGHALFCDMRSMHTRPVPFDLDAAGAAMLVIDTRAEHRHAGGEYGRRRAGCERAAQLLGAATLREVTVAGLEKALARLPDDELRRYTRHVVTENTRVLRTVDLLDSGALTSIGPLLTASHVSLRDDYRVSIPQLDLAVAVLLDAGAFGARMTGGGFGGSVIALVPRDAVDGSAALVTAAFERSSFRAPFTFTVRAEGGVHRVS
jgi:galactokinase